MKARNTKLRAVLNKFLAETLKPMEPDELAKLMHNFPKDLPQTYSQLFTTAIRNNCVAEFEKIIEERGLTEKLDRLDDLVAQKRGFEVSMQAFEFKPSDPEVVKRAIVNKAKRQEIENLQRVLQSLRVDNERLAEQEEATRRQLELADQKILSLTQLIDAV